MVWVQNGFNQPKTRYTKRAPAESGWYYVPGDQILKVALLPLHLLGNAVASGSAINWWSPVESGSATSSGSGSGSTSSGSSGSDSSNSGSTSGGYYTTVSQAVHSLLSNVNPQVLGMAQVYSVGFWGYCRGYVIQDDSKTKSLTTVMLTTLGVRNQKFPFLLIQ